MAEATFRKASFCTDAGTCVEVAVGTDVVRVRHTGTPSEELVFTAAEWAAFVAGTKAGEFDLQNPPG